MSHCRKTNRSERYFGDTSIDDAFNVIDDDGNQYLDYSEFKTMILDKARMKVTDAEFVRLMNVYDENMVRIGVLYARAGGRWRSVP